MVAHRPHPLDGAEWPPGSGTTVHDPPAALAYDGCPRCEQAAERPTASLDLGRLKAAWTWMVYMETAPGSPSSYRTVNEATMCRQLHRIGVALERMGLNPWRWPPTTHPDRCPHCSHPIGQHGPTGCAADLDDSVGGVTCDCPVRVGVGPDTDPVPTRQWVISQGTVTDGFGVIGPFSDRPAAERWAEGIDDTYHPQIIEMYVPPTRDRESF